MLIYYDNQILSFNSEIPINIFKKLKKNNILQMNFFINAPIKYLFFILNLFTFMLRFLSALYSYSKFQDYEYFNRYFNR